MADVSKISCFAMRAAGLIGSGSLLLFLAGCGPHAAAPDADADTHPAAVAAGHPKDADGDADKAGEGDAGGGHWGVAQWANVPLTVSAEGVVGGGANSEVALSFPEAGLLAHVRVNAGQSVARGQTLAWLDPRPFQIAIAQAQADLAAAQANLSKTQMGARPQQRAQTQDQATADTIQSQVAQAQLKREQTLYRLGVAAQADVDAARAAVAQAQALRQQAHQQLSLETHPLPQDVAAAQAAVSQAAASLSAARLNLAQSRLTAPFAGTVIARLHNDDEAVGASTPVVEIAAGAASITFTAQFPPGAAARVHPGDAAQVRVQGVSHALPGRVAALNPAQTLSDAPAMSAAPGRLVPVLIRLRSVPQASVADLLGPGAYGSVTVRVGRSAGLLVPTAAVVADPTDGATLVFRRAGQRPAPTSVTVVRTLGDRTEVSDTALRPGDQVVTQGAYELLSPQAAPPPDDD